MFHDFYRGKTVLVTGHTGFKGSWLSLWLHHLGARVVGLGLGPPTNPNFYELLRDGVFTQEFACDVRDLKKVISALTQAAPDCLFHLAAQPLVRQSYVQPIETLETNALGTANILEGVCRAELPCTVMVVTTDKCYANDGTSRCYGETDPLGGEDVYSMSKAAAELVVQSWRQSFFRTNPKLGNVASGRAGNVFGGGDYAGDRIVPDGIRALLAGQPIQVRHPEATRPWQHVLDCLSGYLWLGAQLARAPKDSALEGPFNFGPDPAVKIPVRALVEEMLRLWQGSWNYAGQPGAPKEAAQLNLAIHKAATLLQWFPTWDFQEAVRQTVAWYQQRHVHRHPDMMAFSLQQIEALAAAARQKKLAWALPVSS